MNSHKLLDEATQNADKLRAFAGGAARALQDYTRRLELILSQDHKNIPVRDNLFTADFTAFCTDLRIHTDEALEYWQKFRADFRTEANKTIISSLEAKSFALRAKTLSRACDEFTTAYDRFNAFYKNYTLSKLPVWLLTSCCNDLGSISGKILFLARESAKKAGLQKGG